MTSLKREEGLTLIELVVAVSIATLLAAAVFAVLMQSLTLPGRSMSELVLMSEIRNLTSWLRVDGNKAQSFEVGSGPTDYGTFHWLDYETYPPTRREAQYVWDEGVVYRVTTEEGEGELRLPMIKNVEEPTDVEFLLAETPHALNPESVVRLLRVTVAGTSAPGAEDPLVVSDSIYMHLRPEQIDAAEHLFFYLHNNPTPPVGDTASQLDLPMDPTAPTATTLYNYDTDNDIHPGREIRKSQKGGELETTNDWEYQDWLSPAFASSTTIDGRASLFISGAATNFTDDALIVISAWLMDYDPVSDTDTLIVSRAFSGFTSTTGWTNVGVHFRDTEYEIGEGHRLRLKVQVDGVSLTVSGLVAYDTVDHLTLLMVPARPSGLVQQDFSDIQFGGTTSGTVLDFGGLGVEIEDLLDPAGFRLTASGSGGGTAEVLACGATFLLTDGDLVEITCGSLFLDVLTGEVTVTTPVGIVAVVPAGAKTKFANVVGGMFVENAGAAEGGQAVAVSMQTNAGKAELGLTVGNAIEILSPVQGEFAVNVRGDSGSPVTVEVDGVSVVLQPGRSLASGPRGMLEVAAAALDTIVDESSRIRDAALSLDRATRYESWIDDLHLDDDGDNVFGFMEDSVRDIQLAIDRGLTPAAVGVATESADRVLGAARSLAVILRDEVRDGVALDPENEREVDRLLGDAAGSLSLGDADRERGNWAFAVIAYGRAWKAAFEAAEKQSETPDDRERSGHRFRGFGEFGGDGGSRDR